MILVVLHQAGDMPGIRELSQPDLLRMAVAQAYAAGRPIPISLDEAAQSMGPDGPGPWAFYSLDAARLWASQYRGPRSEEVRLIVSQFVAARPGATKDDLKPPTVGGRMSNIEIFPVKNKNPKAVKEQSIRMHAGPLLSFRAELFLLNGGDIGFSCAFH